MTTTKTIVEQYRTAAQAHRLVQWFDFNTSEFLFNPQTDLEYPAVFLQLTDGATADSTALTRNFVLYSLQQSPDIHTIVKDNAYDYDTAIAEARDQALQVLIDISERVKLNNQQEFLISEGPMTFDNDAFSGAIGWRMNLAITTPQSYTVSTDFPT